MYVVFTINKPCIELADYNALEEYLHSEYEAKFITRYGYILGNTEFVGIIIDMSNYELFYRLYQSTKRYSLYLDVIKYIKKYERNQKLLHILDV